MQIRLPFTDNRFYFQIKIKGRKLTSRRNRGLREWIRIEEVENDDWGGGLVRTRKEKKVVGGGGICNETLLPICLLSLMNEKYQLTLEEEQF